MLKTYENQQLKYGQRKQNKLRKTNCVNYEFEKDGVNHGLYYFQSFKS